MKKQQDKIQEIIGPQPNKYMLWLITVSMLLIAMGALLPLLNLGNDVYKYVFSVGAVGMLVGRLFSPYKGNVLRVKRLYRIEAWSAIFFCVAVFFMFYKDASPTDWIAFTLAGAVLQIYTSIMIPRTITKAIKKSQEEVVKGKKS